MCLQGQAMWRRHAGEKEKSPRRQKKKVHGKRGEKEENKAEARACREWQVVCRPEKPHSTPKQGYHAWIREAETLTR